MRCKEIFKLKDMLEQLGIAFEFSEDKIMQGYQIVLFDEEGDVVVSVIQHRGSYGNNHNKLEIMGLLTDEELCNDSVVGWLSADNVFNRIKKYISEKQKGGTKVV